RIAPFAPGGSMMYGTHVGTSCSGVSASRPGEILALSGGASFSASVLGPQRHAIEASNHFICEQIRECKLFLGNSVNEDPDQIIRDVGRRVAELRQALELSVSECAQRLEMTYQNLQRIERGEQNLTLRMMIRLATALEVRPEDLFKPPGSGHPRKRKGARG